MNIREQIQHQPGSKPTYDAGRSETGYSTETSGTVELKIDLCVTGWYRDRPILVGGQLDTLNRHRIVFQLAGKVK